MLRPCFMLSLSVLSLSLSLFSLCFSSRNPMIMEKWLLRHFLSIEDFLPASLLLSALFCSFCLASLLCRPSSDHTTPHPPHDNAPNTADDGRTAIDRRGNAEAVLRLGRRC